VALRRDAVYIEIRDDIISRNVPAGKGVPNAFDADGRVGSWVGPWSNTIRTFFGSAVGVLRWNRIGALEQSWRLWPETKDGTDKQDYKNRSKEAGNWFVTNDITCVGIT